MGQQIYFVPGRERTEYVTKEVHEHRAPTDESVKILRDMEDRARKRIVETTVVGDTRFQGVVHKEIDMQSQQLRFRCVYSLNGHNVEMVVSVPQMMAQADAAVELRDAVAKDIADQLLAGAFMVMGR